MSQMPIPEPLLNVARECGEGKHPETTPREILKWYGWERRGSWISDVIKSHLARLLLSTTPDFESAYIDATLSFALRSQTTASAGEDGTSSTDFHSLTTLTPGEVEDVAPAHRISRLRAASLAPLGVKPDELLEKAVTLMMTNDYSQLPVMTTATEVKGVVSWKSIGRRIAIGVKCTAVRDCMDPHREVRLSASLFDVIRDVAQHDFVLVRGDDKRITGIITAADISEQFRILAEPFLLLGDIETHLRRLIDVTFSPSEMKVARDPTDGSREVSSASSLTFGEYVRLLENPDNWARMKVQLDRTVFVADLSRVREIRNDVMHFDPDGIDSEQLAFLRRFALFMEALVSTPPFR